MRCRIWETQSSWTRASFHMAGFCSSSNTFLFCPCSGEAGATVELLASPEACAPVALGGQAKCGKNDDRTSGHLIPACGSGTPVPRRRFRWKHTSTGKSHWSGTSNACALEQIWKPWTNPLEVPDRDSPCPTTLARHARNLEGPDVMGGTEEGLSLEQPSTQRRILFRMASVEQSTDKLAHDGLTNHCNPYIVHDPGFCR